MGLFPKEVVSKIDELGFTMLSLVQLFRLWSVVGLKGDKRYNIQLSKEDMTVVSIHLLRYKYNQWGSRVTDVERVLIQHKDSEKVRVIGT